MAEFSPGFNHIHIAICLVAEIDVEGINTILQFHKGEHSIRLLPHFHILHIKPGGYHPIGMSDTESGFTGPSYSIRRISNMMARTYHIHLPQIILR